MNRQDKIDHMAKWCAAQGLRLELNGKCGFGRECVGVQGSTGNYPDYEWYDSEWNQIDGNGEVFTPPDAYHKHPCVAVLGLGEDAENQLYDWVVWFEENNFAYVESAMDTTGMHRFEVMLNGGKTYRMVRGAE